MRAKETSESDDCLLLRKKKKKLCWAGQVPNEGIEECNKAVSNERIVSNVHIRTRKKDDNQHRLRR